jgi:hypothetical protein
LLLFSKKEALPSACLRRSRATVPGLAGGRLEGSGRFLKKAAQKLLLFWA